MAKHPLVLLIFIVLAIEAFSSSAQDVGCATNLAPRLVIGEEGRVLYDNIVNVRNVPGLEGAIIGQMSPGGMFTVVDGARCLNNYQWWQVDYHYEPDGVVGWIAEGNASEYWLEPRGVRQPVIDSLGYERYYVIAPDGTIEPEGCLQPPDDYNRVWVGNAQLNVRTLFMLDHASTLYAVLGGEGNLRFRITQGSYTGGIEPASFGTHDGGGAVDLSVRDTIHSGVLADVENLVYALRVAGFAAWLREPGLFYPNSPVHIHAIALGDTELSEAARLQAEGPGGYLRGLDGLIPAYGGPRPDQHGGAVVCRWMVTALGITDLSARLGG